MGILRGGSTAGGKPILFQGGPITATTGVFSGASSFASTLYVDGAATFAGIVNVSGSLGIKSTTAISFLNGGSAQSIYAGGILASNAYSDAAFIPSGGIYSKGMIKTAGGIALSGATSNIIDFGAVGVAAPSFSARSVGTKLVLYNGLGASSADYALGIEGGTNFLWSSVPTTAAGFKWYGGTTLAATLTGAGALTITGAMTATSFTGAVAAGNITGSISAGQHGNQGGGALHANATTSVDGFMSAADKVILNNLVASPGGVTSFNTRTGAITLTSGDVTTALAFTPINPSTRGAANGVATLDGSTKIPIAQLPSLSTSNISEGSNLYYTDGRADARIMAALSSTTPAALGTAAVGNGTTLARANHVHQMPTAANVGAIATAALTGTAPSALGASAAAGSSGNVARLDHVHPFPTAANVGALALSGGTVSGAVTVTGKFQAGYFNMERASNTNARIQWYSDATYKAWMTYMSNPAGAVNGVTPSTGTLVTQWAMRSFVENTANYGWIFESGTSNSTTPVTRFEISSVDGSFKSFGNGTVVGTMNAARIKVTPTATGSLMAAGTIGAGGLAYDSTKGKLVISNGTKWDPVGSGGGGAYAPPAEIGPTVVGQSTYILPGSKLFPIVYVGGVIQGDDVYVANADGTITFVTPPTIAGISIKASVIVTIDIEGAGGGAMSSPADIGTGNGVATSFGPLPGTGENPWVFVGSALQILGLHYTVNAGTRMITLSEAPASGVVVSASAQVLPMVGTNATTLNGATASTSNIPGTLVMRDGTGQVPVSSVPVSAIRICTSTPVTASLSDHTLSVKLTVPGNVLVNLPTNPDPGQEIIIKDRSCSASVYNITVKTTDSKLIDEDLEHIIDQDGAARTFKYDGEVWIIL